MQRAYSSAPAFNTAALAVPADVRLMNALASAVYVLAAVGALVAGVLWLMRSPLFPIRSIQLDGDLARNSVPTIRANAAPLLAGNFFSVDLQQGRVAFETVPWVRHAVVRRVWPDRLAVQLEEHRAAAFWESTGEASSTDKLVNSYGEVFEANVGDVEQEGLPTLSGPEGMAAQLLSMYRQLQPVLAQRDMVIDRITLSGRGSWHVELDSGSVIELGRGSEQEVLTRTGRFVRTLPEALAKFGNRPLEFADLRQAGGYAMRVRGISTVPVAAKSK